MTLFTPTKAYITGGSSGIGLAAAKLLAERGVHVVIFARDRQRLSQAVQEISSSAKDESRIVGSLSLDVADPEAVNHVMVEAVDRFGPPDLLINSAGISSPDYFENITLERFDRVMKVNLYGVWGVVQALLPHMKGRPGAIVNVSSVAGYLGVFGFTGYSASKFGVIGFSEALRAELKRFDISVSVLCPPDVDTPMLHRENKTKPAETKAISAGAKVMSAERVALALVKAGCRGRFMIVPGWSAKFTWWMKRMFPGLMGWVLDRMARKARPDN